MKEEKQSFIHGQNVPIAKREGYTYQRYVEHDPSTPFNFLRIMVSGRHKTRRVVHGIRNYYVVAGGGSFTIDGHESEILANTLVTIQPGQEYSYEGQMELVEFNVAIDGKIKHEDIE